MYTKNFARKKCKFSLLSPRLSSSLPLPLPSSSPRHSLGEDNHTHASVEGKMKNENYSPPLDRLLDIFIQCFYWMMMLTNNTHREIHCSSCPSRHLTLSFVRVLDFLTRFFFFLSPFFFFFPSSHKILNPEINSKMGCAAIASYE